ncbi:MAG TPA: dihydropteroate synthase, partial [Verrucomicrobiae bacterium]|nr:dihydropteroate synthase [Verrucomicrobiae bacterium]
MIGWTVRSLSVLNRRDALRELELVGVDPAGTERMAGKMLHHCLLVKRLSPPQANILKQEMLALGGDAAVARGTVGCSRDRTDVLLMGTRKQLGLLCSRLQEQPFRLPSLGTCIAPLLDLPAPAAWETPRRTLDLSRRPLIMGILNVTPDSFSDGNRFLHPDEAVEHALRMQGEGADIIDIGGESTRPDAEPVSAAEELRRVLPVIDRLARVLTVPISIDTYKASVAAAALDAGAEIVNDVSGFAFDPGMAEAVASRGGAVVVMHTRGRPPEMQKDTGYEDLVSEVYDSLRGSVEAAEAAGIPSARIAVDPGIGFAKSRQGNVEILRRLREFTSLGKPL